MRAWPSGGLVPLPQAFGVEHGFAGPGGKDLSHPAHETLRLKTPHLAHPLGIACHIHGMHDPALLSLAIILSALILILWLWQLKGEREGAFFY